MGIVREHNNFIVVSFARNYRRRFSMNSRNGIMLCVFALLLLAGCAKNKVIDHEKLYSGQLPRPAHIWVYDFAATAADLPADSELVRQYSVSTAPQTPEDIATGRKLGALISTELVKQIRGMGMPGENVVTGAIAQLNDLIIRGYLVSFNEGDAAKRVMIGLGSGSSEMSVAVETFQVTAQGLRKLGSGAADSGGSKTPGGAVGLAASIATANPAGFIVSTGMKVYGEASGSSKVEGRAEKNAKEIANVLKKRFQEQGWIK
jgi:hypothetical protein